VVPQVVSKQLKPLSLCSSSSDLIVGQKVFAIGNPFGEYFAELGAWAVGGGLPLSVAARSIAAAARFLCSTHSIFPLPQSTPTLERTHKVTHAPHALNHSISPPLITHTHSHAPRPPQALTTR
jgi:hypothetical protein